MKQVKGILLSEALGIIMVSGTSFIKNYTSMSTRARVLFNHVAL